MFPAAGDGCFYIGMGSKSRLPNPSYEPYQCCPKPVTKGSKVAKLQHKMVTSRDVATKPTPKSNKKPSTPPLKTVSRADHSTKNAKEGKEKNKPVPKGERGKAKKGFFGTGKYIWWW